MGMGNSPADRYFDSERLNAKADAEPRGTPSGTQVAVRRLLETLRPHREEPGSYRQNSPGTPNDPRDRPPTGV
jgi:hypothetical protein